MRLGSIVGIFVASCIFAGLRSAAAENQLSADASNGIAWGPVSAGLQCGIQLESPGPLKPYGSYMVVGLVLRNLRSQDETVTDGQFGQAMPHLTVTDATGRKTEAAIMFSTTNTYRFETIPAGGSITWQYPGRSMASLTVGMRYAIAFDGSFQLGGHFTPDPGNMDKLTGASAPIPLRCGPLIFVRTPDQK